MVAHHQGGKHQGGSALSIRAVSRPLEHPLRASTLKILDEQPSSFSHSLLALPPPTRDRQLKS